MKRKAVLAFMLVLFVLHQDFWLKDNPALVLGIIPASLAYHMAFTALAAFGWCVVVKFAWPIDSDEEELGGTGQ